LFYRNFIKKYIDAFLFRPLNSRKRDPGIKSRKSFPFWTKCLAIYCGSILLSFLFFSCGKIGCAPNKEVNVKYREKNPIETLKIDSLKGNVEVIGWAKDFIEINTNKVLVSGFNQDVNLMDTLFNIDEAELQVKTKIPTRVDGKINLKIYVPFVLLKLYVTSINGDININKFLGDVEITNRDGNINAVFQGGILRMDCYQTNINLYVKSYNSTDIVINNENGKTDIDIESVDKHSFLDIKSLNGDITLNSSFDIDHKITAVDKNDKIFLRYELEDKLFIRKEYNILTGRKGDNINLTVDIFNENGKINLNLANEKRLKKVFNEMSIF